MRIDLLHLHRHRSGFTLLELLLVLLLLSLITAMVTPQLRNFAHGRDLGFTSTELVSLANYGRTQSIAEGRRYRLNVDQQNQVFWLTAQSGASAQGLQTEWGQRIYAPGTIRIETKLPTHEDGQYITFFPNGRCEPASIRLTLENGNVAVVGSLSATETFHVLSPQEVEQ